MLSPACAIVFLVGFQFLAGENHNWHFAQTWFGLHFFQQRVTAHVRQPKSSTQQSKACRATCRKRPFRATVQSRCRRVEQFHDALSSTWLSRRQAAVSCAADELLMVKHSTRPSVVAALSCRKTRRAKPVLPLFLDGNNLDGMCRVSGPSFKCSTPSSRACRQENVQRDGRWQKLPRSAIAAWPRGGNRLEPLSRARPTRTRA